MENGLTSENLGVLGIDYDKDIRPVINLVDDLRSCGLSCDIQLPCVVVVGDQSSGKSSILEALSGVELPRGSGIMTRCPLVLEMKRSRSKWTAELSIANGSKREVESPEKIKQAIIQAQNEVAGTSKMVSRTEITLRISSPSSPDLTLIDLPGITRIAVEGQPDNMPEQIRSVVKEYIQRDNTVILCVISGNLDIAVNESVKLAQEFDPNGNRTLGVITKPDLIDSDDSKKSVLNLLNGNVIQMLKGFFMVRCRTTDESNKITLEESLERELSFFENDRIFKMADPNKLTVPTLSKVMTHNLVELIKRKLPEMKTSIIDLRMCTKADLEKMPLAPPEDIVKRKTFVISLLTKFQKSLEECVVQGEVKPIGREEQGNSYSIWRKNFVAFSDELTSLSNDLISSQLTDQFFLEEITRRQGRALNSMFITFEMIRDPIKTHIKAYKNPAEKCLADVSSHVEGIISALVEKMFATLPGIRGIIEEMCYNCRLEQEAKTSERIKFHLKEEKVIFTQGHILQQEIDQFYNEQPQPNEGSLEECNAKRIRNLLEVYLKIMNRRLADQIPACIITSFNNYLVKSLCSQIINLYESQDFIERAAENRDMAMRREQLRTRLHRLETGESKLIAFSY